MCRCDIAVLWEDENGAACVLAGSASRFYLSIRKGGAVIREVSMEDDEVAMALGRAWRSEFSNAKERKKRADR
jgi:hypothetical protein